LQHSSLPEAYESVARALHAERTFRIDRDFVVQQGKIAVLDHPTGRIAAGRQWPHGIQQSLEAAQGLELTPEFRPAAQITVQRFLSGFPHLSGMTGTAREAARELELQFGLHTVVVAPHRPCRRMELPAVVTDTRLEKWERVLDSVRHQHAAGRPILIGTRDLPASEELSDRLRSAGFRHQLLTARQEAEEAQLIARAGERGMITVSTNIAGRGTDIRLGAAVAELGGLHVIAADLFDAARIDRQLAGRGGRQGDPATYQKIVSLEDAVLAAAWDQPTCRRKVRRATSRGTAEKLDTLRQAQTALEQRHAAARRQLLAKDREHSQRSRTLGLDPSLDDPDA
jgi:preprotein translocase subunit SecA